LELVIDAGGDRVGLCCSAGDRRGQGRRHLGEGADRRSLSLQNGKVVRMQHYPSWNDALESFQLA
jgi:hypothetical protein